MEEGAPSPDFEELRPPEFAGRSRLLRSLNRVV
jgi:hypothetical protein